MTMRPALRLAAVAVVLGNAVGALAQQEVPTLDFTALCKAEAKQGPNLAGPCAADQKQAREELVRQWSKFPQADRASCLAVVNSVAGLQSYVELLTCLQIKQDVRELPKR